MRIAASASKCGNAANRERGQPRYEMRIAAKRRNAEMPQINVADIAAMVDRDAVVAANKNADGRKPKCGNSRKPKNADIAASRSAVIAANKKMRI